jgi:hypothetical protein
MAVVSRVSPYQNRTLDTTDLGGVRQDVQQKALMVLTNDNGTVTTPIVGVVLSPTTATDIRH